jgi:hypothetical protein
MAKFSKKVGGKEVGQADVYAAPHTMTGKQTNVDTYSGSVSGAKEMEQMNVGVGMVSKGNYKPINQYGVGVMRGGGAATKGLKISGKMG